MLVERCIGCFASLDRAVIPGLKIRTRAKGTTFTGDYHRPRILEQVEGCINVIRHGKRARVEPLRHIERDRGDLVGDVELDVLEVHVQSFCFPLP